MLALGSTLLTEQKQRKMAIPCLFLACVFMFFIALSKGGVNLSLSEIVRNN